MTLRECLDTVRTRWRFVVIGLLLGVIVGGAVTLLTPKEYASEVTVFVSARGGSDAASALDAGDLASQRVATYLEVLTSPRVAQEVADAYGPGLTAQQVLNQVTARTTQDTLLLTATVTDPSPDRAAQIANLVADRFVANVTELETTDPTVPPAVTAKVFEPAKPAVDPVVPRPAVNLVLGALLGLLVGTGFAILRQRTDTSVKTPDQLRTLLGVPVLGSIEADSAIDKTPLIAEAASGSRVAEDFRQLRTNLQFLDVDRNRRVWLLTSPTPGAGKTTTVANLALVLAEAGGRVLVVEGDLRRPRLAEILGVDRAVGLTNVLVRRMPGGQAVQRVRPGLDVLASGPLPPNPSEVLGSAAMAGLLAQARERYDVVLVDASPLSPVIDAAAVASQVDGVLLVVPVGGVNRQKVLAARDALETVSAPLLGAVLTMVPAPRKKRSSAEQAYLAVHSELDMPLGERPMLAPAWTRPADGGGRAAPNGNGAGQYG
ncbi:MAG: polysaccharide biosynthesis tyrosine autokinase, partial [Pseudonocardia sp.]